MDATARVRRGLGSTAAWPLLARAQDQRQIPVVGCLVTSSEKASADLLVPFREGLKEAGYEVGRNVAIEYRWADNHTDRLPSLAADLVHRNVTVLVTAGGGAPALAAKAATSNIPVVFLSGEDPVKIGLVESLNRPGGNLTGVTFYTIDLGPKRFEVLRELAPNAVTIGMLVNPSSANVANQAGMEAVKALIGAAALSPIIAQASTVGEFGPAFAYLAEQKADALLLVSDTLFTTRRREVVELAAEHRIPAIYPLRDFVTAGGLASYGASLSEPFRQVGLYVGKILSGAAPAELPIVRSSKIELVLNLKTAKALGLAVPPSLLARADEVIE